MKRLVPIVSVGVGHMIVDAWENDQVAQERDRRERRQLRAALRLLDLAVERLEMDSSSYTREHLRLLRMIGHEPSLTNQLILCDHLDALADRFAARTGRMADSLLQLDSKALRVAAAQRRLR